MYIHITQAEYWLLNLAIDCAYPLSVLATDQIGYHYPEYHGLNNDQLIELLWSMYQRGDIIACDDTVEPERPYIPERSEIEESVMGRAAHPWTVYYGLTKQGGALWEELSNPDWSRYVDCWPCDEHYEVYGGSQESVGEYLRTNGLDTDSLVEIARDELSPWQATYWKQVDSGSERHFTIPGEREQRAWCSARRVMHWYQVPDRFLPFPKSPPVDWPR